MLPMSFRIVACGHHPSPPIDRGLCAPRLGWRHVLAPPWELPRSIPTTRLSSAGKIQTYTYTRMSGTDGTNVWVVGFVLLGPSNFSLQTAGFIEHSADGGANWRVQLLGNGS